MADNIPESLLESYRHMIASRYTDQLQADAAQRGEVLLTFHPRAMKPVLFLPVIRNPPTGFTYTTEIAHSLTPEGLPIKPSLMVFSRGLPPTPPEDACPPFPVSVIFIF